MKFTYAYKTSDGVRHEESIAAKNREQVFEILRTRGIRAIKVVAADGSKANGAAYGVRKRVVTVIMALVAVCAGGVAFWVGRSRTITMSSSSIGGLDEAIRSSARRQLIGDIAVIDLGIKSGWSDVFAKEGDRFLAGFCVPGTVVAVRSVTEAVLRESLDDVQTKVIIEPSALSMEARQIVAIVDGMKSEIRGLLKDGWTLKEVGEALVRRQEREIAFFNRARTELELAKKSAMGEEEFVELWKKRNEELRVMGIRLVPLPE